MKPFNLEAALRGEKVVTRDGREVTQLKLFECDSDYPLAGVVIGSNCVRVWTKEGNNLPRTTSSTDLFMHEEPELAIWKPSACCSLRWVERKKQKPSADANGGYYGIIEKVLQQLYVNQLEPEYEWRDVPTVQEDPDV